MTPFIVGLRSPISSLGDELSRMYADFSLADDDAFADFHVEMARGHGLRRWIRPQTNFLFDGIPSFQPLPVDHAYPMLEWGLNWCIASHSHQYLIIHAAVIERNGQAVIMPAPPGSGKSTLCAGLVSRGWRLLSDELTLLDVASGLIQPLSRPINLKNHSIDVIREFQPDAVMTVPVAETTKGTVALLRPPADSVRRTTEPAKPAWIVFPRYQKAAPALFTRQSKATTCMRVAEQSFNYHVHGQAGFQAVVNLVDGCGCAEFCYGNLDDAIAEFNRLSDSATDDAGK